jgi:hypothetical protein
MFLDRRLDAPDIAQIKYKKCRLNDGQALIATLTFQRPSH